jgi:hypothetical protein
MNKINEILKSWTARILGDSKLTIELETTFCLNVEGQDGGIWTLECRGPGAVHAGEKRYDCKITIGSADLVEIAERRLNPQRAWLEGRIRLDGDTLQALKLNRLFYSDE